MSADDSTNEASYVQLFQKAHQKIVMLERLNEQLDQIAAKREELQDELRELQTQINEEIESRLKAAAEAKSKVRATEPRVDQRARFAGQTIEAET